MNWYSVHLLFLLRLIDVELQKKFLVWENIYAVIAEDARIAVEMAINMGKDNLIFEDPELRYKGKSARWEFLGVRKCMDMDFRTSWNDEVPQVSERIVGEATFLELEFSSLEKVNKYLKGEKVSLVSYD